MTETLNQRAILIDPEARTVTEVYQPKWSLASMLAHLTFDPMQPCDDVNMVRLVDDEVLWVDGEGFIRPNRPAAVWTWSGYSGQLAGRGLILGLREDGENMPAAMSLAAARSHVHWTDLESTGTLTPATQNGQVFSLGEPIVRPSTLAERRAEGLR